MEPELWSYRVLRFPSDLGVGEMLDADFLVFLRGHEGLAIRDTGFLGNLDNGGERAQPHRHLRLNQVEQSFVKLVHLTSRPLESTRAGRQSSATRARVSAPAESFFAMSCAGCRASFLRPSWPWCLRIVFRETRGTTRLRSHGLRECAENCVCESSPARVQSSTRRSRLHSKFRRLFAHGIVSNLRATSSNRGDPPGTSRAESPSGKYVEREKRAAIPPTRRARGGRPTR